MLKQKQKNYKRSLYNLDCSRKKKIMTVALSLLYIKNILVFS